MEKCLGFNSYLLMGPIGPTGPTGPQGVSPSAPTFEIGTVTTGLPGSQAAVYLTPIRENQVYIDRRKENE